MVLMAIPLSFLLLNYGFSAMSVRLLLISVVIKACIPSDFLGLVKTIMKSANLHCSLLLSLQS